MDFTLSIWRQKSENEKGHIEKFQAKNISSDTSFLEMLDQVNEEIIEAGGDPVAFEHDCREGICGSCNLMVNGIAHGPQRGTSVCQLHMRSFEDGQEIIIEPWRARAFPIIKDLVVDRSSFDKIIQAGGFVSVNTGGSPDANAIPIKKADADEAFNAATCIGCGACVAACKNASAMLFVSAKVGHLRRLPQGEPEAKLRAKKMLNVADAEGFGHCTNTYDCQAVCPKEISVENIAMLNRDFVSGYFNSDDENL